MIFDTQTNLKYKYRNRKFWCKGFIVIEGNYSFKEDGIVINEIAITTNTKKHYLLRQ